MSKANVCLLGIMLGSLAPKYGASLQAPATTSQTPILHYFVFRCSPQAMKAGLTWSQRQSELIKEGFIRSKGKEYESLIDPKLLSAWLVSSLGRVLSLPPDANGSITVTAQKLGGKAPQILDEILSRAPFGRTLARKNQTEGLRLSVVPYATLGVTLDDKPLFISLDDFSANSTSAPLALAPKSLSLDVESALLIERTGLVLPSEIVDAAQDSALADLRAKRKSVKEQAQASLERSCRTLMDPDGPTKPKDFAHLSPGMQSRFRDQISKSYKDLGFKSASEALGLIEGAPIRSLRFDADIVVNGEGPGDTSIFSLGVLRW